MLAEFLGMQQGSSKKSGKDFTILYYAYADARIHGQGADKVFIFSDSGVSLPAKLEPGDGIDLSFNQNGYLSGVSKL